MNSIEYISNINQVISDLGSPIEGFSIEVSYDENEECLFLKLKGDGGIFNDRIWLAGIFIELIDRSVNRLCIDISKLNNICEPFFELFIELNIVLKAHKRFFCLISIIQVNNMVFESKYSRLLYIYNNKLAITNEMPFFTEHGNKCYLNNKSDCSMIKQYWELDVITSGLSGCSYSKQSIHEGIV